MIWSWRSPWRVGGPGGTHDGTPRVSARVAASSTTCPKECSNMRQPDMRYFLGLDLGMAGEFTALAVVERPEVGPHDPPTLRRPAYTLRHLHRFPLGTPYAEVVEELRHLLKTPPLEGAFMIVDQTGVGRAVVDLVFEGLDNHVTCRYWPVLLSAGHEVTTSESGQSYIPKKELISCLQALLQTRRLQIPPSLPNAAVLVKELQTFKFH